MIVRFFIFKIYIRLRTLTQTTLSRYSNPEMANSLSGLQEIRKRAPPKHSRRCLEIHTGAISLLSEAPDEEVDYGSFDIDANPNTDSDHTWSTLENDSSTYIIDYIVK